MAQSVVCDPESLTEATLGVKCYAMCVGLPIKFLQCADGLIMLLPDLFWSAVPTEFSLIIFEFTSIILAADYDIILLFLKYKQTRL